MGEIKSEDKMFQASMEGVKNIEKVYKENWNKLFKKDQELKEKGELVGRFIQESYADGFAVYTIKTIKGKKALIQVVTGIGDDWRIPYWGDKALIDLKYAVQNIERRDTLNKLFEGG